MPSSSIAAVIVAEPVATAVTMPVFASTVATDVLEEEKCTVPEGDTEFEAMLSSSDVWLTITFKGLLANVIVPVRSVQLLHSMQKAVLGLYDDRKAVYVVVRGVKSDMLVELYIRAT